MLQQPEDLPPELTQKKEIANNGATSKVISNLASGGTFAGAWWMTFFLYLLSKMKM